MALNFPNSPVDGQIYYDSSSGNRYVYSSANTVWLYSSNTTGGGTASIDNTSNTQILYNYQNAISGSNSLTYLSNTLYVNAISITDTIQTVNTVIFNVNGGINPLIEGRVQWNASEQTLDIGLANGSILQTGQETVFYVRNQTGSTIPEGVVVRSAGTLGTTGRLLVAPFKANGQFQSEFCLGVTTTEILNGGDGYVTSFGKVRGIDTTAYSEGTILYANATSDGSFATTIPTAPNNKITVAIVIYSDVNGIIFVRPTIGSRLDEDELAEVAGLANGDVLVYNSTRARFENNPQSALNVDKVDGFDATTILGSANGSANAANAYTVTVGAAGNTAAYIFANGTANSANAYALTLWTNALTNANNDANSANIYAMVYANSIGNTLNTVHYIYANNVANSVNSGKVTSVTGTAGQIFSSGGTTPTLNLVNTAVTANTYGSASVVPVFTVDGQGRITYAANVAAAGGGSMDYAFANTIGNNANSFANTKLANTSGVSFAGSLFFPSGNVSIGYGNDQNFKLAVNGSFVANTKSFVIPHPTKEGLTLRYGSLEGPENGVYVRGKCYGNTIYLPDYWTGLIDESTITVNLTPYGRPQELFVSGVYNNTITIISKDGSTPDCYYHVYAERKDVDKLIVEF